MSDLKSYASTVKLCEIWSRIEKAKAPIFITHERADGDALGCLLALARDRESVSIKGTCLLAGPLSKSLQEIAGNTPLSFVEEKGLPQQSDHDLIVICDTGSWSQLAPYRSFLENNGDLIVGLDHHAAGDNVAKSRVVESSLASCCQLVKAMLEKAGRPIGGEPFGVGEALLLGIGTDTGWFRHSNSDAAVFKTVSELLDLGVDRDRLYRLTENSKRPSSLGIIAKALGKVEYLNENKAAMMCLESSDFSETGAGRTDLNGLVNYPLEVKGVGLSVLVIAQKEGGCKASFRSNPPDMPGDSWFDVRTLSGLFGGGGHVHAAGARFNTSVDKAAEKIRLAICDGVGVVDSNLT